MLGAVMSIAKGPSWGGNRIRNALMLTAVIELVLGGGFLVGGFLGDSVGLMLTGAILAGVGLLLLLWARSVGRAQARARAIVATGLSGIAKIESVTQTGVVLNEIDPQVEMDLEIHVEGRDPYMVKTKEFVPGAAVGVLTAGNPLPVKVDPNDLSQTRSSGEGRTHRPPRGWTPPTSGGRSTSRAKVRESPRPPRSGG